MRSIDVAWLFLLIALFITCQPNPYRQGQVLYQMHCGNCHMEDGSGLSGLIPPLDGYGSWDLRPDSLVCIIRRGLPVNPETGQSMPPNRVLNHVEMANLLNYLMSLYSKNESAVQVAEVTSWSESCQ